MYEDRKRQNKRWHQALLTSRLNDQRVLNPKLNHGSILVLSGPNPEEAIKYYAKYKMYRNCILVESNRKTFAEAYFNFDPLGRHIELIRDDIFVAAKRHSNELRGIDFDFCTTLKEELVKKIAITVARLEKPCIWFRVTSCHRGIKGEKLREKQNSIVEAIKKLSDYQLVDEAFVNYRDKIPMNTWQVVMRNNRKMEDGTMRTLREMTHAEKDMARALVDRKYDQKQNTNYSDDDIARVLQMSPYSVSALKAHVTMRDQNN